MSSQSSASTTTATADAEPPQWPDDVLYLPVAADSKGPDTAALPGTWDTDGTGCTAHDELTDRRWGIVDTACEGWRLLTVDLDVHKMAADRAERVADAITDGPSTRVHTSQSGGLHVFYWLPTDALTDDGTLSVAFGVHIDDKLNGYVLSPHCEGYAVREDHEPAVLADATTLPDVWLADDHAANSPATTAGAADAGDDPVGVYDVLSRANYPPGERVAHPYHESDTGTNFMVDDDDTWRCWRHDVTGSGSHLLGMEQGRLTCGEWGNRTIPDATWREIYDTARADGYDIPPPTDASAPDVRTVWEAHVDAIEAAEMPADRLKAAEPVFREMAKADVAGESVEMWIEQIAATSYKLTKTTVRNQYEAVRDDLRDDADDDPEPLDQWLQANISRVVVRHSTDNHADNLYKWVLADDVAADLRADHFTTTGTAHNKWQNLDNAIFETLGVEVTQPDGQRAGHGEFSQWIKSFINDHRADVEVAGARTQAVEWLADKIHSKVAYPDLETAVMRDSVWMPAPDASELAVKSAWVRDVVDKFNITYQGLHHELDAGGYLAGGSKVHHRDGGRKIRMWHLSTALAEPNGFEPAPEPKDNERGDDGDGTT